MPRKKGDTFMKIILNAIYENDVLFAVEGIKTSRPRR